jgi:ribonuclease PH
VALHDAVDWLKEQKIARKPDKILTTSVAAISVGVVNGVPVLDLPYEEDVAASVDMNVVCTGEGDFVEVQGTGEEAVFNRAELDTLLDLAVKGCKELAGLQARTLLTS